jgi:hypothetical protein
MSPPIQLHINSDVLVYLKHGNCHAPPLMWLLSSIRWVAPPMSPIPNEVSTAGDCGLHQRQKRFGLLDMRHDLMETSHR